MKMLNAGITGTTPRCSWPVPSFHVSQGTFPVRLFTRINIHLVVIIQLAAFAGLSHGHFLLCWIFLFWMLATCSALPFLFPFLPLTSLF